MVMSVRGEGVISDSHVENIGSTCGKVQFAPACTPYDPETGLNGTLETWTEGVGSDMC